MRRLFMKMVIRNKKEYVSICIMGILVIFFVFFSMDLSGILDCIATGEISNKLGDYVDLNKFALTYILLIMLLLLFLLDYIRKRSYVYGLLETLGIKKKHKYMFIMAEYLGIFIVSVIGGVLLAVLVSILLRRILCMTILGIDIGIEGIRIPLKMTVLISIILFSALLIICDQYIACFGIESLLNLGKSQGKSIKYSKIITGIGIASIIVGLVIQRSYWGKLSKMFPAIFASAGLLVLAKMIGGWILIRMKEKKYSYYRRILWIKNLYHRFNYNFNIYCILSIFIFVSLFVFGLKIVDNYPVDTDEFKYDLVWMANEEDESFLKELENKYSIEIDTQEYIRLTTPDFGEHIGVSVSQYEEWTGKRIELNDDEVYIIYQRNRDERSELGIDYSAQYPRFHIGHAHYDLWIHTGRGNAIPSNKFVKYHRLKGTEDNNLIGIFYTKAKLNYVGKVWEDIVVFSDDYYSEVNKNAEGSNLLVMINIEADYNKVVKEIYSYAEKNSERNFFDRWQSNFIYEKKILYQEMIKNKVLNIFSNMINFFILLICVLHILYLKWKCDSEELNWKYHFYYIMGMQLENKNKYIYYEICIPAVISLICGIVFSGVYVIANVCVKGLDVYWMLAYAKCFMIMVILIVIVFIITVLILAKRTVRENEKRSKND